jgi:cobyric acid synthase
MTKIRRKSVSIQHEQGLDSVGRTIRQVVVDGILLRRQLGEEQLREILDSNVLILDALRHLTELTLDLDHSIQNQVSQDHERRLLHPGVGIEQALVQVTAIFVDDGVERYRDVTQSDDAIRPDVRIFRSLEDLEEQAMVLIRESRTDTQELAQRQMTSRSQCSVLK